ncbi:Angiogenic factor with G patch and FHA domains 1, partial [Boothiomyces sp. JEL0838]
ESVWEKPEDYIPPPPPKPKQQIPTKTIPEKREFQGEERLALVVLKSDLIANAAIVLISEQGLTIGRDKSFEERLRLNELAVSRYHCSIYFQREFKIVDNGSTHGTFLNNIKLSHSKQSSVPFTLSDGDVLEIGSTKFQVHLHELCEKCDPAIQSVVSTAPTAKKKVKVVEPVQYVPKVNLEKQRIEELERLKQRYLPNENERVTMAWKKDRLPIRELPEPVQVKESLYKKPTVVVDKHLEAPLDSTNKGNLMLQKMGWKEGQGLGKEQEGIVDPLKMSTQKGRRGLGA